MTRPPIESTGRVAASPEQVFAFLAVLENHWALADDLLELVRLAPGTARGEGSQGGCVRMHGPLRVSRTAVTRVVAARAPTELRGTASIGRRTRGEIAWSLREDGQGTRVTLRARVEQAGVLDRLLLALGGEAWLLRCFGRVLARLAEAVPAPGDAAALHGAPACPQAG